MFDRTSINGQPSSGLQSSASGVEPEVSLRLLIAPFARAQDSRAWGQVLSTFALFLAGWAATAVSVTQGFGLLPTLLLAIPTAGFVVRLFIVQHDCGHGSFFSTTKANDAVGAIELQTYDLKDFQKFSELVGVEIREPHAIQPKLF